MALGDRLKVFSDILTLGRYFFTETLTHDPDAVKKRLRKEGVPAMLGELDEVLATVEPFDVPTLEKAVHDYAERSGRRWARSSTRSGWRRRGRGSARASTTAWRSSAASPAGPGSPGAGDAAPIFSTREEGQTHDPDHRGDHQRRR